MHWLVVGAAGNTGRFWMAALGGAHWPVTGLVHPYQYGQFANLRQMRVDWSTTAGKERGTVVSNLHFIDSLGVLSCEHSYHVVLAVKSSAVEAALEEVRAALGSRLGLVLIPTNGLYGEHHAICTARDTKGLVSVILTYPCEAGNTPDCVRVGQADRGIGLAAIDQADRQAVACLRTDLENQNPDLRVSIYDDYRPMKWTKLLLNLIGNVIPAILDRDLEAVYRDPRLCRLEMLAIDEIAHLIAWLDFQLVGLPGYPVDKLHQLVKLAHLEHWFGWSGQPTRLFVQKIVPKILSGRGGKLPSLLISLRGKRDGATIENLAREALNSTFSTPEHNFYPALSTLGTVLQQRWDASHERLSVVTADDLWAAYQQRVKQIRGSLKWRLRRALP